MKIHKDNNVTFETLSTNEQKLITKFRKLPHKAQCDIVTAITNRGMICRRNHYRRLINNLYNDNLSVSEIAVNLCLSVNEVDEMLIEIQRLEESHKIRQIQETVAKIKSLMYVDGYSVEYIADETCFSVEEVLKILEISRKPPVNPIVEGKVFLDSRDGQAYRTVKIGNQIWLAENLRYKTFDSVCYDNDDSLCTVYGRLYRWETAKEVSPAGWHLPGLGEWREMINYVGGEEVAGNVLKSVDKWAVDGVVNGGGIDNYGFAALPGGYCTYHRSFRGFAVEGMWWTSTGMGVKRYPTHAHCWCVGSNAYMGSACEHKNNWFSVRCVADGLY